jgi:hypothetical protein
MVVLACFPWNRMMSQPARSNSSAKWPTRSAAHSALANDSHIPGDSPYLGPEPETSETLMPEFRDGEFSGLQHITLPPFKTCLWNLNSAGSDPSPFNCRDPPCPNASGCGNGRPIHRHCGRPWDVAASRRGRHRFSRQTLWSNSHRSRILDMFRSESREFQGKNLKHEENPGVFGWSLWRLPGFASHESEGGLPSDWQQENYN